MSISNVTEVSAVVPIGDVQQPVDTTTTSTTTFTESSNVIDVYRPSPPRPIADPYPDTTPLQLLNRTYQITVPVWTPGFVGASLPFPGSLLLNPTISAVMNRYRFLRSDVSVEIRLNSTPYHQGSLIIGFIPCSTNTLPTSAVAYQDQFFLSGLPGSVIISASTQDSVRMDLPWLAPIDWYDNSYMTAASSSIIGSLFIRELNPLVATSSGQTASVPLLVYATFKNPRVTGFISDSSKPNKEAQQRNSTGLDAKGIVSTVSKVLRTAPVIGNAYGLFADAVNAFAGDLSKPITQEAPKPLVQTINQEYNQASGLSYAKELTLYPGSRLTQSPIFETMETSHMSVVALAQRPMMYATSSLSATNTTISVPCIPNTNYVSSPAYVQNVQGDWFAFVAKAFQFWRGSIKYMFHLNVPAFYSFRVRLALRYGTGYVNVGDLQSKIIDIKGETWLSVSVPYLWTTMYRQPANDVIGSTTPYLQLTLESSIVGSSSLGAPFAYVNIFRSAGEDTQFAQLKGVKLSAPHPMENGKANKKARSDACVGEMFKKPFDTLVPGIVQGQEANYTVCETVNSVSDCIKRPSLFTPVTGSPMTPWLMTPGPSNSYALLQYGEPFQYFSSVFRFWRGSLTFGRLPTINGANFNVATLTNTSSYYSAATPGDALFYSPTTNTSISNNLLNTVNSPYFAEVPWQPMNSPGQTFASEIYTDGSVLFSPSGIREPWTIDQNTWIAAGDDFMLLYPAPYFPYAMQTTVLFADPFAPHP